MVVDRVEGWGLSPLALEHNTEIMEDTEGNLLILVYMGMVWGGRARPGSPKGR